MDSNFLEESISHFKLKLLLAELRSLIHSVYFQSVENC